MTEDEFRDDRIWLEARVFFRDAATSATSATPRLQVGDLTPDGGIAGITHHLDREAGAWLVCSVCGGSRWWR